MFRMLKAMRWPLPGSPRRFSTGTFASSKTSGQVELPQEREVLAIEARGACEHPLVRELLGRPEESALVVGEVVGGADALGADR